ncbi:MAG: hypothetical protein ACRDRR_17290 [Pseudonocardiaceae bacterium]
MSRLVVGWADIDAPKQSRQPRLAALGIMPHLGDDDRVAAQLHTVALRHPQPSDQHLVIALRGHERAVLALPLVQILLEGLRAELGRRDMPEGLWCNDAGWRPSFA